MRYHRNSLFTLLFVSSLLFTGCFKWGARAFHRFPETTALVKSYNYDGKIIIVGAGASGLAAAKILEQNNIEYKILEASNRYGGRLEKDTTLSDFPIDLGAEWIHNQPAILNRLIGKSGDSTNEELIPYRLENAYNWDGSNYEKVDKKDLDNQFDFFPEYKFKKYTWFDYVNDNLASSVKQNIYYDSPVSEINYADDEVVVTTSGGQVYTADKLLLTVSIGVLKSNMIKFIPELDEKKKKAINRVDFLPGFKLIMKFSEKFYPDAINIKTQEGEHGYYDMAFKKESDNYILALLSTGSDPYDYFGVDTEAEIVSSALSELDEIFDGRASNLYSSEYIIRDWGSKEFILGTWTNAPLNRSFNLNALNESLDGKVYFSGEINDIHRQMGVPGAILSGYVAVDKLLLN